MLRRRKRAGEEAGEPNLIAVLNVMFLLIPALLLAMEVASFGAVHVSPPLLCNACTASATDPPEPPLNLKVRVLEDGFWLSAHGQQVGGEAGRELDRSRPTIALAHPGSDLDDFERYDYATLEAKAREYKTLFPHETVVTLTAESGVPLQALISTMDALRGRDCSLAQAHDGEDAPAECYFWQPVVEGGNA